ncbi:hypothetical protein PC123_g1853 [Phytophthora cactorum]|nr:hypothetical protein PC123_g1853 [Phytophthora cactorum]
MRNLLEVLPRQEDGKYLAAVTDRFYTSVQLALQLLARKVYLVGTIQTNKRGFPPALITKETTRQARRRYRCGCKILPAATSPAVVGSTSCIPSFDRKQHRGRDMHPRRHVPGVQRIGIPCPSAMRDYYRWMGGVDIQEQLRLQRYSLQFSVRFRKYYQTIFLGLVDMAMVNAFIVYREAQKLQGRAPADHAGFLEVLQSQLLQTTLADFIEAVYPACELFTRIDYDNSE